MSFLDGVLGGVVGAGRVSVIGNVLDKLTPEGVVPKSV